MGLSSKNSNFLRTSEFLLIPGLIPMKVRHAELDSASVAQTLKRVQGDVCSKTNFLIFCKNAVSKIQRADVAFYAWNKRASL